MPKKPIKIEVIEEGDERFLLRIFSDGSEERRPIQASEEEATPTESGLESEAEYWSKAGVLGDRRTFGME